MTTPDPSVPASAREPWRLPAREVAGAGLLAGGGIGALVTLADLAGVEVSAFVVFVLAALAGLFLSLREV